MLLVSYEFAAFFVVLVLCYFLAPDAWKRYILLFFSLIFYLYGGAVFLLYPAITAVTTFFLGKKIGKMTDEAKSYVMSGQMDQKQKKDFNRAVKRKQRRLLICGLVLNFGILAVLKYVKFILSNLASVFVLLGVEGEMEYAAWVLPLGISYYTFQSMGYLIDVYNRKYEPENRFSVFFLFLLFFPQLTAGPISRFDIFKNQISSLRRPAGKQVVFGMERMLWGYFKKLVIADRLGPAVSIITGSPETYRGIWFLVGMIICTVWLFADFSGAMDIVIGAAEVFGICLPENFDRPFSSKNLAELWRRWHMTLMQWFKEYIFFPVSASGFCKNLSASVKERFGKKAASRVPVYAATLLVWFVTGIWHGASWNFIIWGMANGIILLISQELSGIYKAFGRKYSFTGSGWYQGFQKIRTFFLFAFLQMFLYYPAGTVFSLAAEVFAAPDVQSLFNESLAISGLAGMDLLILMFGVCLMWLSGRMAGSGGIREKLWKKPPAVQYGAVFFLFLLVLITGVYGHGYFASQFIYNQF